jgi:hypothetical protein
MRFGFLAPVLAGTVLASLAVTQDASACGGCIHLPNENTIVSGHRMALSISSTQTVLWDQIKYDGSPESFAWVLPIKKGAVLEVSTDAWFETLDATTSAQLFAPFVDCGNDSGSLGCGAMEDRAMSAPSPSNDSLGPAVAVLHRGTVGPYETVTLSTKTPGALNAWLMKGGYQVDPSTQPVIDTYIAEGFDFIAIKLQPDKDVKEMKPVRVVMPGASMALPLRMVAIGTGANVAISLFVISEGRWEADNFGNATIPLDLLAWDFKTNTSNYGVIRDKALAQNSGATWLTTFAQPQALLSPLNTPFIGATRTYGVLGDSLVDTIAAAYIQRGIANNEDTTSTCTEAFMSASKSSSVVIDPCGPGKASDDPSCGTVDPNQIDARTLECGALDDVAVALTGMHPSDVWVTRLEANLPRAALATDLLVRAAPSQKPVDNVMQATTAENADVVCESQAAALPDKSARGGNGRGPLTVALGAATLGIAAALRRLRARPTRA